MPNIVKNTTIISLPELLAPHSCRGCDHLGNILCDCCKNNIIQHHQNLCPICKTPNHAGICSKCTKTHSLPPIFIVDKRSTLIGELAHDFKYYSIRALVRPLAEILDQTLPSIDGNVVIVPLPTISRHIRERGFDHTHLVAKHLSKLRGKNYQVQKLFTRAKNTIQVGTSRTDRLAQAKDAYTLAKNISIDPDATYLLYDDVWTTGASMLTAVKKLRSAGANKIIVAILALSSFDQN